MKEITTFKANSKTEVYYLAVSLLLLTVFIIFSKGFSVHYIPYLSGLLLIIILVNLISFRLNAVQLDKSANQIKLIKRNFITLKTTATFTLTNIQFTYKQQATSFRGGTKNVCSIYHADKTIARLIAGKDGWTDNEVKSLVTELIHLSVKKKFVGYSLKDAET